MYPDGTENLWTSFINPRQPIPVTVTKIHGIDDAKVADAPPFGMIAAKIFPGLNGVDTLGYNVKFDIGLLQAEFSRHGFDYKSGRVIDAFWIYTKFFPRDLSSAVREYLGREHLEAHTAEGDVRATMEVFEAQLARHTELPRNVDALASLLRPIDPNWVDPDGKLIWKTGEAVFNFGKKYNGRLLRQVPTDFLTWILNNDFSPELKAIIQKALKGDFPKREATP
jgi:DNA polymerase-3 subunit epsilon